MISVEELRNNYLRVLERIAVVAQDSGRDPAEVKLVVVTKGHPLEVAQAAVEAGVRRLGENYPEEGVQKALALSAHPDIEWHMIGHVQSRKARLVCQHYDYVHSVDRLKLARRLSRAAEQASRELPILLQFNVSGEGSKFGWPAADESAWEALFPPLEELLALPNLEVRGLMTMPPFFDDPERARPYFQRLRRLRDVLAKRFPQAEWDQLSMGMSNDYEVAIGEGATMVRVGQAILGPRP